MSRNTTPAVDAANAAPHVILAALLEMQFTGGTVRFTDQPHNVDWAGNTYIGVGQLAAVASTKEVSTAEIVPMRFTLSGIDQANRVIALTPTEYKNKKVTLYTANFDPATRQIVASPTVREAGYMDTFSIALEFSDDPAGAKVGTYSVEVTAENQYAALTRPIGGTYCDEDQRARYPGDTGLQLLNNNAGKTIAWPSAELQYKYARR